MTRDEALANIAWTYRDIGANEEQIAELLAALDTPTGKDSTDDNQHPHTSQVHFCPHCTYYGPCTTCPRCILPTTD